MHILQYGMQYIHVWYMYYTLYILHMYHMYMHQCVMPLHNIDVLYDMMYRQYITSHITCVVLHDIYTVPCSSMCSILMVYTCTTALYIYICNVCKSICIHVYTYVWSSVLYDVLHTQYLHTDPYVRRMHGYSHTMYSSILHTRGCMQMVRTSAAHQQQCRECRYQYTSRHYS